MTPIIAFCGFKHSGKSTAASVLRGRGYVVHALATPIKRVLGLLGVDPLRLSDPKLKEEPIDLLCGRSPRHAMQTLGTEWGRRCLGEDFWLRVWDATRPSGPVVVDDVRFPNEAEFLRARGGRIYRIERMGSIGDRHVSERAHLEISVNGVIVNDGSADFRTRVETFVG